MLINLKACLLILLVATTTVSAQEINTVKIGLLPYTHDSSSVPYAVVEMLQNDIIGLFENNKRFVITSKGSLANERLPYQRQDIKETGKLLGAEYLIGIHYNKLYHKTSKGMRKVYVDMLNKGPSEIMADLFSSDVQFSIKVYDVTTGELRADQIIFGSSGEVDLIPSLSNSQPDVEHDELLRRGYAAANKKACEEAIDPLKWYLDRIFSFSVPVKNIEEPTQLGSCKIFTDGGKNIGISKDVIYGVYILEDITTAEAIIKRKRNLAYAYNVKNITETSAELKVMIGKKAIVDAYHAGQSLYVTPGNGGLDLNPKQIITIAISPLSVKEDIEKNDVNWLEEFLTNSVVSHGRLKVVERRNLNLISTERELQKTEAFMDAEVIKQGMSLGAEYMIFGEAYQFKTWFHTQKKELDAKSGYFTNLKLGVKLVNTATGKVEADKIISVEQYAGITSQPYSDPNKSQSAALLLLKAKINRLMLQAFPLELEIVEITDTNKKGEAKKLMINGGSAYGLHMPVTSSSMQALAGTPFEVFEVNQEEVDGQVMERTVEIGEIVLKDVENDLISECKVRNGGDVIAKNFKSGKKMVCRIKGAVISD